jgi:archaellum component FlaC
MPKDMGDQLDELMAGQLLKADKLKEKIDEDEGMRGQELKEMKAITEELEKVDYRLGKMKLAKKQYTKTLQECRFALRKIEETAEQMAAQFADLNRMNMMAGTS